MDSQPACVPVVDESLGLSSHRLVCDQAQQSASPVLLSGGGSVSPGGRCAGSGLDRNLRIRIPSVAADHAGPEEDCSVGVPGPPRLRPKPQASVVQSPGGSPQSGAGAPPRVAGPPRATTVKPVALRPPSAQSARVSAIQRALRGSTSFRPSVLARIVRPRRGSTMKVYDNKWKVFCDWCLDQGVVPQSASIEDVAHFLEDLFLKGRQPVTIKGYRSALSQTFRLMGRSIDLGSDVFLNALMSNFCNERPRERRSLPRWSLPLILRYLQTSVFEPLGEVSLLNLTLKSCFLITLALGARASEAHALSRDPSRLKWHPDGSVTLPWQPLFLAKSALPSQIPVDKVLQPLSPAARSSLSRCSVREVHAEGSTLCPVRALQIYLDRTGPGPPEPTARLFRGLRGADVTPQRISGWIRKVIRDAYAYFQASLPDGENSAHEVRAIASSVAYWRNVSLQDLVRAVGWRNKSTFGWVYLRDLSDCLEDLTDIGPLVVAGRRTSPLIVGAADSPPLEEA